MVTALNGATIFILSRVIKWIHIFLFLCVLEKPKTQPWYIAIYRWRGGAVSVPSISSWTGWCAACDSPTSVGCGWPLISSPSSHRSTRDTVFYILSFYIWWLFYSATPYSIYSNDSRKVKVIGKIKGKIITPNCWRLSTPTIPGILNKGDNRWNKLGDICRQDNGDKLAKTFPLLDT